ncbi:unnamed protein product [Closterium sp. Naga37s-1]|nr:unnamed protein product [Closterium sp. Naga37s-1]
MVPSLTLRSSPFAPHPFAPHPFAPHPFAPHPFAPHPFAPHPFAPHPFASHPFAPHPFAPHPFAPHPFASHPFAPTSSKWKKRGHTDSCRAARFAANGRFVVSAAADKSIVVRDVETGERVSKVMGAHSEGINRLACWGDSCVASGDDSGTVKLWDLRQDGSAVGSTATVQVASDYLTDIRPLPACNRLLAASGDGSMAVVDLATNRLTAHTDSTDDDLLSIVAVKSDSKVVCGSQSGLLYFFNMNGAERDNDRFRGHGGSVDAIVPLDDDTLLTACSDGLIRVVSVFPNRFLDVVGSHTDAAVEALALSHDHNVLVSAGHDQKLKAWDIAGILDEEEDGEDGEEEEEEEEEKQDEKNEAGDTAVANGKDSNELASAAAGADETGVGNGGAKLAADGAGVGKEQSDADIRRGGDCKGSDSDSEQGGGGRDSDPNSSDDDGGKGGRALGRDQHGGHIQRGEAPASQRWLACTGDVHWGEITMVDAERRLLVNTGGVHSSHPPSPPHSPSRHLAISPIPSLTPQDVHWGETSMVDAECRLLANALLDPGNARFILVSESCALIPTLPHSPSPPTPFLPPQDVHWGEISMVDAERRLLANALLDPGNARFILVSESCAPLFNFTFVYEYLMASPEAYVRLKNEPGTNGRGRWRREFLPLVRLEDWRKGGQWFAMDREAARVIVADDIFYPLFKRFCRPPCYADEHYMPTMLKVLMPGNVANRTVTWTDWSKPGAAHPAQFGSAAAAIDSTEALYNALIRASARLAGSGGAGGGGAANASAASLAWTASLLRDTGVDQEVINARNSGLGALLVAPTNYAWQQFFDVLERANAKQPAGTWPDVFVGYPSVTATALVAAASSITTPSSSSPPNITRTFSNLSAPLNLDALSPEGTAALRGVLLLHVTGAYHLERQLEEMAIPNASNPRQYTPFLSPLPPPLPPSLPTSFPSLPSPLLSLPPFPRSPPIGPPARAHIGVGTNQTIQIRIDSDRSLPSPLPAPPLPQAPQHGHIYAVGTNQTIQIHIESDKSLVFRVPANANTPVRDSPYTAYSVTAAATVLPALKDAVADGRLAVQGADHVLVPPTGPANAGGKGRLVDLVKGFV